MYKKSIGSYNKGKKYMVIGIKGVIVRDHRERGKSNGMVSSKCLLEIEW